MRDVFHTHDLSIAAGAKLIHATTLFGVSTCWRSRSIHDGGGLARAVAGLGVNAIEIDYRLTEKVLRELLQACGELDLTPLSIHAVCPAPADKQDARVAEAFELSDADERKRRRAVDDVAGTLRLAGEIGARAVIVHAGTVPMERVTLELQKRHDAGTLHTDDGRRFVNACRVRRLRSRGTTFDQLCKSLDELAAVADRCGVYVGLENRYYLREYPCFEEMAVIFSRMRGSRIAYWHDTGHAKVQENLGIVSHDAWLREFSGELIGVHFHDVDGYTDHIPPPLSGEGSVDFSMIKPYLKPGAIRILELRDEFTPAQARAGVAWLAAEGLA